MTNQALPDNLVEMLKASAARWPQKIALLFNERKLTYAQLDQASDNFARALLKLGLSRKRVAIFLLNSPEFIISYFGIIKSGATAVPVNNMFKQEETKFILEDAGCAAVITSSVFMPVIQPLRRQLPQLKHAILTDAVMPDALNFPQLCKEAGQGRLNAALSGADVASILYTSGTTGHPKGAMLTHKNFIANVASCAAEIKAGEKDNIICMLPMFHSFAWTVCVLMPIFCGASITIVDTLRPFRKLVRNVIKKKVTIFVSIPSIFHVLSEMHIPQEFSQRVLEMIRSVRLCISGAAALPAEVLEKFQQKFRATLLEGYGLTEAAPVVTLNPYQGRQKPGSIGLPIKDVRVRIVDGRGQDCLAGQPGELLVKGGNVMRGYLNQPQDTAETIQGGWLYTGDIARFDGEGYLYIVDRKKEMINVRGLNVYPKEIENVLVAHPAVKEAAVVRAPDRHKGEVPLACIVLKEGLPQPQQQEIVRFLRPHLAEFKIPKHIVFVSAIPKNTLGKTLKRELEKQYA